MARHPEGGTRPVFRPAIFVGPVVALCLTLAGVAVLAGCSGGQTANGAGSSEESSAVGAHMAGAVVDVNVTPEALASKPKPWVLTTHESAVRSFLDWTAYAYRIGQFEVAKPTMTTYEEVRVDSYIQYNIQKSRLIDQKLESITFGTPSIETSRAIVPVREKWTYNYVSISTAGKVIGGPYSASYDSTYTVVKSDKGDWIVDSIKAKALGEVK